VRYKAKSSPSGIVASFKWQRRPHGTDAIWADIGMESILEHTEDTAGDFDVRVVGVTSSGEVPSDVRRIFIVQLNPQAPTQVMALHVLGSYAYVPDPPEGGPYTISFEGSLSALTSTPPDIGDMKLKWGWIQGAKMSANSAHYVFHHLEWFANAQQGVTAQFWKENRYDLPEPETEYHNDAFDSNSYLYASGKARSGWAKLATPKMGQDSSIFNPICRHRVTRGASRVGIGILLLHSLHSFRLTGCGRLF
jgi:hypothetical protein